MVLTGNKIGMWKIEKKGAGVGRGKDLGLNGQGLEPDNIPDNDIRTGFLQQALGLLNTMHTGFLKQDPKIAEALGDIKTNATQVNSLLGQARGGEKAKKIEEARKFLRYAVEGFEKIEDNLKKVL
jgi:hypothetical protein